LRNITFDLSDMHLHGSAFYSFLKLRKSHFVDSMGWDIPTDGIVEMDQYDTPLAHYSVVLEGGRVVGGARCLPTNVSWGGFTNMLQDSARGLLEGIPRDLFDPSLCGPETWEGTRLIVSDAVVTKRGRLQCLALTIDGLVRIIRSRGGTSFLTLSPLPLQRTAALVGLQAERLTHPCVCEADGREYAVFRCKAERALTHMALLGIDAETHEVANLDLSRAV